MNEFVTDKIVLTIGNEIELNQVSLQSILIYTSNTRLITMDDIEEIKSLNTVETVSSHLSTKKIEEIINSSEGYIRSYTNPLVISIKLKKVMPITCIKLITVDKKFDPVYQFMKIEYANQSNIFGDDHIGTLMLIEECKNGWHPETGKYVVDFNYTNNSEFISGIEQILQVYVKKNEFELWFKSNYNNFVNDVANRVANIIIGHGKKY